VMGSSWLSSVPHTPWRRLWRRSTPWPAILGPRVRQCVCV
jgi:hypothetical protein